MNHCTLHSPHTEKALKSMHGKKGIINKMPNSGLRLEREKEKRKRGNEVARKREKLN